MTMDVRERLAVTPGSTERDESANGTRYPSRFRAYRNGLPLIPYEYRARVYPWAQAALAAAEAAYGPPFPVCGTCGAPLVHNGGFWFCRPCPR